MRSLDINHRYEYNINWHFHIYVHIHPNWFHSQLSELLLQQLIHPANDVRNSGSNSIHYTRLIRVCLQHRAAHREKVRAMLSRMQHTFVAFQCALYAQHQQHQHHSPFKYKLAQSYIYTEYMA